MDVFELSQTRLSSTNTTPASSSKRRAQRMSRTSDDDEPKFFDGAASARPFTTRGKPVPCWSIPTRWDGWLVLIDGRQTHHQMKPLLTHRTFRPPVKSRKTTSAFPAFLLPKQFSAERPKVNRFRDVAPLHIPAIIAIPFLGPRRYFPRFLGIWRAYSIKKLLPWLSSIQTIFYGWLDSLCSLYGLTPERVAYIW